MIITSSLIEPAAAVRALLNADTRVWHAIPAIDYEGYVRAAGPALH